MDPLSQAVFGVMGAGLKKPKSIDKSSICKRDLLLICLWGALAGMAPDIDYFIRSSEDPLLTVQYHRQITHSIIFIPFGALIVSLFLKVFKVTIKSSYPYTFLGYATHGLLDSCTNYGTILFWPFSDKRYSWNLLAVIDPMVTLPLLILLYFFVKKRQWRYIMLSWIFFFSYLSIQSYKKVRIKSLLEKNHFITNETDMFLLKPTIFNNFLWRVIIVKDDKIYFHGVHHSFISESLIYEGDVAKLVLKDEARKLFNRVTYGEYDFERFSYFTSGYLHWYDEYTISDSRYSLLPNSSEPLWTISYRDKSRNHVEYNVSRKPSKEQRRMLLMMLKGESGSPL